MGLKDDLQAAGFELVETHISWVFLGPSDVFKIKRPVELGFLDFRSVESRKEACEAEVRLNRRLAPDVYLGVVPVTVDSRGVTSFEGSGRVVDWAVHMRRLRVEARADTMLAAGSLGPAQIDAVAARVAEFHEHARCDGETSRHGEVETIRRNVIENFEQTHQSLSRYLTPEQIHEVQSWQLETLRDEERFAARIRAGRIRDGHGDLRLEHVYFEPASIAIIDCIEFNDRFRYGDVCADIAFLSMDLAWHGRGDLGERLLARYARHTNDYGLYSVVDFYESYRAFVRGKIACFLADDVDASAKTREQARRRARRYFLLSLAYERPPIVKPRLIAVGGLIASGKSRTADVIAELLAAPVISSDRTRKHLMGRKPGESIASGAWSGAYSASTTEDVYRALETAADTVVVSGRPVVVDASFRTAQMRGTFRALAARRNVPFLFVECHAPRDVLLRRLEARGETSEHESDARAGLLEEFEKRFDPIVDLRAEEHFRIDTSEAPEVTRARLEAIVGS